MAITPAQTEPRDRGGRPDRRESRPITKSAAARQHDGLRSVRLVLLGCLLALSALTAALFASSARATPACPTSTTLTPGSQGSASSAVLYCGGTYTDTWNAQGESDWIAFYTTQASATVVAHYVSTDASGEQRHDVNASFFDPGSATESFEELAPEGPVSTGNLEPRGLSYTFSAAGLHYVEMAPYFNTGEGTGYQLSLSGEWSQTPPPPPPAPVQAPTPPPSAGSKPAPAPLPACVVPRLGRDRRLGDVERRIRRAHCSVGSIRHVHGHVRRGLVVRLLPHSGTHLVHGNAVVIVVSSGMKHRGRRRAVSGRPINGRVA